MMKKSIRRSSRSDVLQNWCPSEVLTFHRKTPESLFSNVAGLKAYNFVKKRLQHRCFPEKFAKCLRTKAAAYEFCSGGCIRIASVSKYIIISNQCIKVNA